MEDWPKDRRWAPKDPKEPGRKEEDTPEVPFFREAFPLETPFYEEEMDPYFHPEPPLPPAEDDQPPVELDEDWHWREPENPPFEDGMWPWPDTSRKPESDRPPKPK